MSAQHFGNSIFQTGRVFPDTSRVNTNPNPYENYRRQTSQTFSNSIFQKTAGVFPDTSRVNPFEAKSRSTQPVVPFKYNVAAATEFTPSSTLTSLLTIDLGSRSDSLVQKVPIMSIDVSLRMIYWYMIRIDVGMMLQDEDRINSHISNIILEMKNISSKFHMNFLPDKVFFPSSYTNTNEIIKDVKDRFFSMMGPQIESFYKCDPALTFLPISAIGTSNEFSINYKQFLAFTNVLAHFFEVIQSEF